MGWSKLLDVESTPFEFVTSLTVVPDRWRRLGVGALLGLAGLAVASIGTLPTDPGPWPEESVLIERFCWSRPLGCQDGRLAGFWVEGPYETWRARQRARWFRRSAAAEAMESGYRSAILARMAAAGALGLVALAYWRISRPIDVRRNGAGIRVGRMHVARGQLAGIEARGRLRLHIDTHEGQAWTSPPLWIDPVELDGLVAVLDDDVAEAPDPTERIRRDDRRRVAAIAGAADRGRAGSARYVRASSAAEGSGTRSSA